MKPKKINYFINFIEKRQAEDYDNLVAISGKRGKGKSTLSIQLLLHKLKKDFNFKHNIAYTQQQSLDKLLLSKKRDSISLDEGIRAFYKRNWNKTDQKELMVLMNEIRFKQLFCLINAPDIFDLDKDLRKLIEIWILVVKKGYAMIFLHDENAFNSDPWHIVENQKIIKKYYKTVRDGIDKLMEGYRHSINYVGEFKFDKLPPEIEKEYKKQSENYKTQLGKIIHRKNTSIKEEKNKKLIEQRNKLIALIFKKQNNLNIKNSEIARTIGTEIDMTERNIKEILQKLEIIKRAKW